MPSWRCSRHRARDVGSCRPLTASAFRRMPLAARSQEGALREDAALPPGNECVGTATGLSRGTGGRGGVGARAGTPGTAWGSGETSMSGDGPGRPPWERRPGRVAPRPGSPGGVRGCTQLCPTRPQGSQGGHRTWAPGPARPHGLWGERLGPPSLPSDSAGAAGPCRA